MKSEERNSEYLKAYRRFEERRTAVALESLRPTALRCEKQFVSWKNLAAQLALGSVQSSSSARSQDKTLDLDFCPPVSPVVSGFSSAPAKLQALFCEDENFPPEGIWLSEVYTLLRRIGEGGYGRIYLARDNNLDIHCAIKILDADAISKEKFFREIQITARLRHPNIVSIFHANQIGRYFYYVMEYIQGRNCEELASGRGMRIESACSVALELAQALKSAHENGVIHRDIKPSNIMLDESGSLKLLDLGLAISSNVGAKDPAGKRQIVGTPFYLSPEQARGDLQEIDVRTDIYNYGATLYHLFTGVPPFRGENIPETLRMVLSPEHVPANPNEIREDLPPKAGDLVMKCLAREPVRRFQNMDEVLAAWDEIR